MIFNVIGAPNDARSCLGKMLGKLPALGRHGMRMNPVLQKADLRYAMRKNASQVSHKISLSGRRPLELVCLKVVKSSNGISKQSINCAAIDQPQRACLEACPDLLQELAGSLTPVHAVLDIHYWK